jgi:hypothetical protein
MVMAAARTLARRRMGACETTPPAKLRNQHATPLSQPQTSPSSPLDDLPPLAGVKLVRPRRCAALRGCGRSSLTLAARQQDRQLRGRIQKNSQPSPAARVVTGSGPYALLTLVGAAMMTLSMIHSAGHGYRARSVIRRKYPAGSRIRKSVRPHGRSWRSSERPPRRDNPIALTGHIADLENQLYPGRRQPRGAGIRNYPPDGSDAYAAPLQRNIRIRLIAPIFGKTEAENPRAEVHGDVKVVRKDLKPQVSSPPLDGGISERSSSSAMARVPS